MQLINKIKSKWGRIQIQVNSWHRIRNKVASAEVPLPARTAIAIWAWSRTATLVSNAARVIATTLLGCTQIGSLDLREAAGAGSGLGPSRAPTVNHWTSTRGKMLMMAGPLVSLSAASAAGWGLSLSWRLRRSVKNEINVASETKWRDPSLPSLFVCLVLCFQFSVLLLTLLMSH